MRFNPTLPLLPFLAACATAADEYPSLALRDAERATGTFRPAASGPEPYAPPAAPDAVLDRLARLSAEAATAHQAFLAAVPRTRDAIGAASGSEAGDEAWARAHVALAALEAERSRAMIALADLDRLYVDAAVEGMATGPIAAARDAVAAQVAQQDATVAAFSERLL